MKKLLIVICALFLSNAAFAALDRDYFDYTQSPEFQSIPTDTSAAYPNYSGSNYSANGSATTQETIVTTRRVKKVVENKGKKRIRFGNEGSSWINTYWNFGQPNYGETGRF